MTEYQYRFLNKEFFLTEPKPDKTGIFDTPERWERRGALDRTKSKYEEKLQVLIQCDSIIRAIYYLGGGTIFKKTLIDFLLFKKNHLNTNSELTKINKQLAELKDDGLILVSRESYRLAVITLSPMALAYAKNDNRVTQVKIPPTDDLLKKSIMLTYSIINGLYPDFSRVRISKWEDIYISGALTHQHPRYEATQILKFLIHGEDNPAALEKYVNYHFDYLKSRSISQKALDSSKDKREYNQLLRKEDKGIELTEKEKEKIKKFEETRKEKAEEVTKNEVATKESAKTSINLTRLNFWGCHLSDCFVDDSDEKNPVTVLNFVLYDYQRFTAEKLAKRIREIKKVLDKEIPNNLSHVVISRITVVSYTQDRKAAHEKVAKILEKEEKIYEIHVDPGVTFKYLDISDSYYPVFWKLEY